MAYFTKELATINRWDSTTQFQNLVAFIETEECDQIIIFGQTEHDHWSFAEFDRILDIAKSKSIPITIVNGSAEVYADMHRRDEYKLVYFPTFFHLWCLSRFMINNQVCNKYDLEKIPFENVTNYKYHFVSLNSYAHRHRMEMMDILAMYDLIDSNAISWRNLLPYPYKYQFWQDKVLQLTDNFNNDNSWYDLPKEYSESFCQLVVESDPENALFVTEKTVTPLLLGKPFLVASCPKFHKFLESLGYQLYTEIFDYSFDDEPNQTIRFCMIADNLRKISTVPLNELKHLREKIKDKLIHNRNLVIQLATNIQNWPLEVQEVLHKYKTEELELDHITLQSLISMDKLNNS